MKCTPEEEFNDYSTRVMFTTPLKFCNEGHSTRSYRKQRHTALLKIQNKRFRSLLSEVNLILCLVSLSDNHLSSFILMLIIMQTSKRKRWARNCLCIKEQIFHACVSHQKLCFWFHHGNYFGKWEALTMIRFFLVLWRKYKQTLQLL